MKLLIMRVFTLGFFLVSGSQLLAQVKSDLFALPPVVAIENRKYDSLYTIDLALGYLPSDAYNRYISASLGLTYKLSPTWNWEVLRYDYLSSSETPLKQELRDEFSVDVQSQTFGGRFLPMTGLIRTGILWEPFYNKGLFADRSLVYSNLSVVLNLGYVTFDGRSGQPMTGLGGIYKIFLNKSYSFKVDFRQSFIFDSEQGSVDFTELSLGIGYHFGGLVTR